jgi:glycosyltransferase involved in cell wall biosynthesis
VNKHSLPYFPLVSVIIPTYNRAKYIAETIESVLAQTYPNIEVIVIDDGSTDNTREVIVKYAPAVQYMWQENAERGASRNQGLRLATGEFIAFLDSDDLWLSGKLERDVEFLLANPDVGLVYTDIIQIDANGNDKGLRKLGGCSGNVTQKLLRSNFVFMAGHLARTSLIREIGGFREERELSGSEDWEMWVRLSTITQFAYLPDATGKTRTHEENTMSSPHRMLESMAHALEVVRNADYLTPKQKRSLKLVEAKMALVNAINYCSRHENRRVFSFLKQALGTSPLIVFDPRFAYTIFRSLNNRLKK